MLVSHTSLSLIDDILLPAYGSHGPRSGLTSKSGSRPLPIGGLASRALPAEDMAVPQTRAEPSRIAHV